MATAGAARARLDRPGVWAARCHFRACLVGVGSSASDALEGLGGGLRHVRVIGGEDGAEAIKAAFKRVVDTIKETLVTLVTTTTTVVKVPGGGGGGGSGQASALGRLQLGDRRSG